MTPRLLEELHVQDATENELYAAMDWLLERQKAIETKLAKRHLTNGGLVLYDVSSSYYEGETCPLARYGHDRDGKTGRPIIVYGVLTDAEGSPRGGAGLSRRHGRPHAPSPIRSPSSRTSSASPGSSWSVIGACSHKRRSTR